MDGNRIGRLLDIMARLRDPQSGCPWDREQTFRSIAPLTIEEAYEVAEAALQQDWPLLKEELGDLLFHVVFHARMASERDLFDFDDVVDAISDKMRRRHPHVFGPADEGPVSWDGHKDNERRARRLPSALDGIAGNLPALIRAWKIQKRVATVGFGLESAAAALRDVRDEIDELSAELGNGASERLEDELGDVLFSVVNLARHLEVNPESALGHSARKFETRFRFIEEKLAGRERNLADCTAGELHELWMEAKRQER